MCVSSSWLHRRPPIRSFVREMYNYTAGWAVDYRRCVQQQRFETPINQKHLYAINYIQVVKYITYERRSGAIGIDMRLQVYFEIHFGMAVERFQCNQKLLADRQ